MDTFVITGQRPLRGTVTVSGSKNAVLPCLAATLLVHRGRTTLTNVPDIADVHSFIAIVEYLGAKVAFKRHTLTVDASHIRNRELPVDLVGKIRASILLLGPLVGRFGSAQMAYPGGCVIGKRSADAHLHALKVLGASVSPSTNNIVIRPGRLTAARIVMSEMSVTATENALLAAATLPGTTEIRLAASEPHVQDLCLMLQRMGVKIAGVGTSTLVICGKRQLQAVKHRIVGDAIEMGTFAVAATIVPGSRITIRGVNPEQLDAFWNKLTEAGGHVTLGKQSATVRYAPKLQATSRLETRVYPGFPTDLQAPFALVLARANGVTKVFETLFEGRFNYLAELEKMHVRSEVYNPHQALIIGPTEFKAAVVESCDLRAGATLVLAALAAEGISTVYNINYIDRGYERFAEKLTALRAAIERRVLPNS